MYDGAMFTTFATAFVVSLAMLIVAAPSWYAVGVDNPAWIERMPTWLLVPMVAIGGMGAILSGFLALCLA